MLTFSQRTTILTLLASLTVLPILVYFALLLQVDAKVDTLTDAILEMKQTKTETTEPVLERVTAPQESPAEEETEPAPVEPVVNAYEAELIGRTIWGEAGGIESAAERAAVAWCILNRMDALGQTVEQVVTAPYQFHGYRDWGECPQEHIDLAADVLARWTKEKEGVTEVGRVLPAEYLFFIGDGEHNHFTTDYRGTDYWDWSLTDPYK